MTAFEYVYLMNEFEVKVMSAMAIQFSIVSAFLVAVYAVSHRLSLRMLLIVIGVYTLMSLLIALNLWSTMLDMALLGEAALAADATGLVELPPQSLLSRGSVDSYRPLAQLLIALLIIIYAASLYFAFGVRHTALARQSPVSETHETEADEDAP